MVAPVRIFIAGCARSGTTLMQRLMGCFEDVHVEPGEHPPSRFDEIGTDKSHVVVKRNSKGWEEIGKMHPEIRVLYMVRHPWDVLTSYHPRTESRGFHVTPERWLAEWEAWKRFAEAGTHTMRLVHYEDLVRSPDTVQVRLSSWMRLFARCPFSDCEDLFESSVGRGEREHGEYLRSLPEVLKQGVAEFCGMMGYEL